MSEKQEPETVYWMGSEEDEQRERLKACKARIAQYGDDDMCEHDGMCGECEHDMAVALRVSKATFDRAVANGEIEP